MDATPPDTRLVVIDPASLDTQQQRILQVTALLQAGKELSRQAGRLMDERRCILLRMRDAGRAQRLMLRADAILGEVSRLIGDEHTPLAFSAPVLPGHPLAWWALQWTLGLYNAWNAIGYLREGRWGFALMCAAAVLCFALWAVPSLRLARQGKWH